AKNTRARHLQARVLFLDKAAKLLAEQQFSAPNESSSSKDDASPKHYNTGLPVVLASHLHTVAKRGQIRVDANVKRGFCKTCATPLLEGKTSATRVENASKQSKKPWADVETITCLRCGTKKRFPVKAQRQKKKSQR
ncbi:RNAse P, Rpr2/Rpp21 subunit, partial [Myriangium duriaei CBS 260.36]